MKIGFDIRPFLSGETGVGVYFKNLLSAMAKMERDDIFYLFSSSMKEKFPREELPGFGNEKFKDYRFPVSVLNFFWFRMSFPPLGLFFGEKLDITHSPNPLPIPGGKKKIITVHDLSFIDMPDLVMSEAVKYFSGKIRNSLQKADAVIAVSEFTKNRIIDLFGFEAGEKTEVIYHGSDLDNIDDEELPMEIPDNYILFTGTIEPRKNLSILIKGYALVKKDIPGVKLILAGQRGRQFTEIQRLISLLKLDKDILITGYIPRKELKYLYRNASVFIFPSHYEGFGLPLLEAAVSGVPSVASDLPVFREIFKKYPVYFDRENPEALAAAVKSILSDKELSFRKKREALETGRNFSWGKAAGKTLDLYDKIGK